MALPTYHSTPDAPLEATTDLWGDDGAGAVKNQAGGNPVGIVVAAAGDGLKADLTLLGLDDLLDLPLSQNVPTGQQGGLAQLLATVDLPADLTALELAQVLGLKLDGATLPTLQEVVQLALQSFDSGDSETDSPDTNTSGTDSSETDNTATDSTDEAEIPLSSAPSGTGDDFAFIDDLSLTEQAQSTTAASGDGDATGGDSGPYLTLRGDGLDDDLEAAEGNSSPLPEESTATVNMTVTAVNDAPTTNNVSASGAEDAASITVTLTGSDVDGTVTSFSLATLPANGTLYTDAGLTILAATGTDYAATGEALTLYFVPDADYNGVTNFDFAAKDNGGLDDGSPATATITVTAVNDAPTAVDDSAGTAVDSAIIAPVLTNDSDVDLDTLTITGVTQGANGTVVNNGDGTVTYTPNISYTGADSFTYTVDDGNGGTDTAMVNVTVTGGTINGTADDDILNGSTGDDTINGQASNDTLTGGAGADALDGGTGTDAASYNGSASAVNVDLSTGTGSGGDAQGDTLANIENLTGSGNDDTLTGDGNDNVIDGGVGNDVLDGGAGEDELDGGAGNDVLSGGALDDELDGGMGADTLDGGSGDDDLDGDAGDDVLDGGAGEDDLDGGAGDDILVWDADDDEIEGGSGTDTLRVDAGDADITAFGGDIETIENVDLATDTGANALTLTAADVLDMTDNADTLTIDGDALDSVDAGGGWTDGGVAGAYHVYTQGGATLNVDTDVTVNGNILV